jgi:hypothetical protein
MCAEKVWKVLSLLALPAACHLFAQPSWDARAIVGWHQAGASSAEFTQNVFFDFYVARPFGPGAVHENPFSLWGQVRVASAPQQKSIPVSQFAAEFASQLGTVPVNELAQSGEFLVGFEYRPRLLKWTDPERIRTLGLVGFFGANGAFSDPTTTARVFRAVPAGAPQFQNFVANFPEFADSVFRERARFVGLVPPDRERFYRQYGGGIRYTSYDATRAYASPAMFTATVGQDQMITHGRYHGPVFKVDAFYPLPMGDSSFIFLFGTANLAITKATNKTPIAMQLVSGDCPSGTTPGLTCGVKVYQDDVAVYAIPSARDTYRLGIGIDFISLIKKWKAI